MTKTPHVHAELIKAWADNPSLKLQCRAPKSGKYEPVWMDLDETEHPKWLENVEYRIKPEPKPDVIKYMFDLEHPDADGAVILYEQDEDWPRTYSKIKLTFDGETGKLKSVKIVSS